VQPDGRLARPRENVLAKSLTQTPLVKQRSNLYHKEEMRCGGLHYISGYQP